MSNNPFVAESVPPIDRAAILAANPGIKSAAHWFWWIVGLSVINTVLLHSGSQTSFAVGLGFTLMADVFFQNLMAVAMIIDVVVVGFFVLMGFFAVRGHRWAFLVGGIVYALDALIFLYFQDYLALAIHAWALFSLTTGGLALHRAIGAARVAQSALNLSQASASATPPVVQEAREP